MCMHHKQALAEKAFMSSALKSKSKCDTGTITISPLRETQVSLFPAGLKFSTWFKYQRWKTERD